MSKGNTFENDLLKLIFNATAISLIADNTATTPLTQLFVALHTADPGEGGSQTTSEAAYTGYARVAINRNSGGWTVATNAVTNAVAITFPACTGGSAVVTHFSVGTVTSGAGKILYSGPLTAATLEFTALASNDTATVPGSAYSVNDQVVVNTLEGSTMPVGLTTETIYFVKTAAGTAITLAATQGGATIDITADGAGLISKINSLAVSNLITPSFAIGQLTIKED